MSAPMRTRWAMTRKKTQLIRLNQTAICHRHADDHGGRAGFCRRAMECAPDTAGSHRLGDPYHTVRNYPRRTGCGWVPLRIMNQGEPPAVARRGSSDAIAA